jgi:hypothetical protein
MITTRGHVSNHNGVSIEEYFVHVGKIIIGLECHETSYFFNIFLPSGRLALGCYGGSPNPNLGNTSISSLLPLAAACSTGPPSREGPSQGRWRWKAGRRRCFGCSCWSMVGQRWCGGARQGAEEIGRESGTRRNPFRRGGGDCRPSLRCDAWRRISPPVSLGEGGEGRA